MIYDLMGKIARDDFGENMSLDYGYDADAETNYTLVRVFQTKRDGTKQFPFIRYPGFTSAAELAAAEGWSMVVNAGLGWDSKIDGIAIENGIVKHDAPADHHAGSIPMTIDANGTLSYAAADASAADLAAQGIVSATCGFYPIIVNYASFSGTPSTTDKAMRTIIGQFGNGDYAVLVAAGRSYDHSAGFTIAAAQTLCKKVGMKFAYNMDGGKSTAAFLGKHRIYDFQAGTFRIVPSFLVFNGSDTFSIPSSAR